jgi:hypothetical protein
MKGTVFYLSMLSLLTVFGCSKDDSEKNTQPEEYDYRTKFEGSYESKAQLYTSKWGQITLNEDTICAVSLIKKTEMDSAFQLNFLSNSRTVHLTDRGVISYYGSSPDSHQTDSIGYIRGDSVYLYYTVFVSRGGYEWYILKGKRK